jgi:hypothetical protein
VPRAPLLEGNGRLADLLRLGQIECIHEVCPGAAARPEKKTDVVENPEGFNHVGLLVNKPPGLDRAALYLVIRRS